MDVESEQSFHDLEQRYITLKKEHDLVLVDKDSLQGCNAMNAFTFPKCDDLPPRLSYYSQGQYVARIP